MIKSEILYGVEETTEFLNSLEKKGYNTTVAVIGVTQSNNHYTVFYKYLESLEKTKNK